MTLFSTSDSYKMNLMRLKKIIDLFILLAFLCLLLEGCEGTVPVDINIIRALVSYFVASKALDLSLVIDRHKAFFIFKRTQWLGARNSDWQSESDYTSLKSRLNSEYTEVENYIQSKDDFLHGRSDHATYPHLDIDNVSRPRHVRRSRDRQRAVWYRELRRDRCINIIWRGAALYPDIWNADSDDLTATLKRRDFDMIIDRRLRAVERMQFQVASSCSDRARRGRLRENGCLGFRLWQERAGPTGPWKDRFRVRMFEYARVGSRRSLRRWESIIGSENIGPGKDWEYGTRRSRLEYNGPLYPGDPDPGNPSARLPASQQSHWLQHPGSSYRLNLRPTGITGSSGIDDMFKTHIDDDSYRLKDDWWHRSWLFCDHVVAAINIEALIFGLRRAKGNANDFDEMVNDNPDYVSLDWFVSRGDDNVLMADDDDPYFENIVHQDSDNKGLPIGELQVGDQLIFWNSQLYGMVSRGDWRLENAYVMDVESTSEGGINLNKLVLQGHGTGLRRYPLYRNRIARTLNHALNLARDEIRDRVNDDPNIKEFVWIRTKLIKWSPFGEIWRNRIRRRRFRNLGAWWVLVPVNQVGGNVDAAISQLRRAFKVESDFVRPTYGDGTEIPPDQFVFFPIYEPIIRMTRQEQDQYRLKGTWAKYIDEKRSNPSYRVRSLRPMVADGILMPGIERRGVNKPIPAVRCKYHDLS